MKKIFASFFLIILLLTFLYSEVSAQTGGPTIGTITPVTTGNIEKFTKFEISFNITNSTYTNPYFPYDTNPPPGVTAEIGISVDSYFLPPGQTNWANAKKTPCFYYQPMEQVGSGSEIAFMPIGAMDWRCRFAPDAVGTWQYRTTATDQNGTTTSSTQQFTAASSTSKGYIHVSPTDSRFFEFSNGIPFVAPLINTEGAGQPYNSLYRIRQYIPQLGQNGISFVRWFASGEGTNPMVAPFGDFLKPNWGYGYSYTKPDYSDISRGKKFSLSVDMTDAVQKITVKPGHYRFSFWARTLNNATITPIVSREWSGSPNMISGQITSSSWNYYSYETDITSSTPVVYVGFHATANNGSRIDSILFQRLETNPSTWGGNILTRSDPETYNYVDQQASARLDETLNFSEQYGVYHKIVLFEKNDHVLNCFISNGTT